MKELYSPLIYIADDNKSNLVLVVKLLKDQNYRVSVALDGPSLLEMVKVQIPDLFLLDIMMPEMNGLEVCKKLKDDINTKDIPVIFLTAKAGSDDIVEGFETGGVDYITKPFKKKELIVRMQTHLDLYFTKKELKESNLTKDKLFSIISHDLRGPISSISEMLKILSEQKGNMPESVINELLFELSKSSENTFLLLENLLSWSRSQSGSIRLDLLNYDVNEMVDNNVQVHSEAAKQKKIVITKDIPPGLEANFDLNTINAVLRNLISNAIKFTPENGNIHISAFKDNENVTISVRDSGIGIKPQAVKNIFKIEKNKSTKGTRGESGSGLGLVLCKEFIDQNKGTIYVETETGKGTDFIFTLSLPEVENL